MANVNPTTDPGQAAAQAAFDRGGNAQATDPPGSPDQMKDGSVNAAFQPEGTPPRKSALQ
jgi:hypothetical protein